MRNVTQTEFDMHCDIQYIKIIIVFNKDNNVPQMINTSSYSRGNSQTLTFLGYISSYHKSALATLKTGDTLGLYLLHLVYTSTHNQTFNWS